LAFGLGFGSFVHQKEPSWKIPAMVCAGFWGFTAFTVDQEGLFGFIPNHIMNYWRNQVFYDLLFSAGLFWFALAKRAKKVGMPLLPWFIYVVSVASLGGLNMYARILYLEEQQGKLDDCPVNVNSRLL
ncbi:unnamed protein product, partial [Cylindrotheca closterium]